MEGLDRITIEPGKMGGQRCIRGQRFTVEHLLSLVGAGWTLEEIQADFPFIEAADIQQAAGLLRSRCVSITCLSPGRHEVLAG